MIRRVSALVLAVAILSGCATSDRSLAPAALGGGAPQEVRLWPDPPATARIRYLFSVREPGDLGYRASFLTRLVEFVSGKIDRSMVRPYALATAGDDLVVADPGAAAVHLLNLTGSSYRRLTKIDEEELQSPVGVAYGAGLLFISDSALNKVFVLTPSGEPVRSIDGLKRPTGIAFDPQSERLYVAETLAHQVAVLALDGTRLATIGERGKNAGNLNFPTHLSVHNGTLVVNDTMNFRLQAFGEEGELRWSFGTHGTGSGHFAQPKGVGVDRQGHIYVADAVFNRVQIFDKQGRFLLAFGGTGSKAGDMYLPAGLAVDRDRIFVADSYNRRVQVFEFLGGS